MRYLGGKTKIAHRLAPVIQSFRQPGQPFWDAFCGSLAISLALPGPGVASDACAPLIAMYQAIEAGWQPPATLSRDEWQAAKALPDSDPLKAFAGFACSYRGLWFAGYAGGYVGPSSREGAIAARDVLLRDIAKLKNAGVKLAHLSFFDVPPESGWLVYLDPPYAGTAEYDAVPSFDRPAFLARAQAWADAGSTVLVSEYALPIGREVWSHSRARMLAASGRATERLFYITPGKTTAPDVLTPGAATEQKAKE